jgi:hypothetical protein
VPRLQLSSSVDVACSIADVRAFFSDPHSLARWDRSVVKVVPTSEGPPRAGSTFSTIGPPRPGREGLESKYRIVSMEEDTMTADLVESPVFETARWTLRLVPAATGTRVTCALSGSVRARYFALAWLLRLNSGALEDDMFFLKRALEHGEIAKR